MYQSENFDVFISYSTKNKSVADAVVSDLESHGIKCWYAPRNIMPGTEWAGAITDALNNAKILVLIYTDDSNESRQVMNEIALQFNANKPIVPFRMSDVKMSSELEYYLTRVHWLDALDKTLPDAIGELREYVSKLLENKDSKADAKTIELVNPVDKYINASTVRRISTLWGFLFAIIAIAMVASFTYKAVKMINNAQNNPPASSESGNVSAVTPDIPLPPDNTDVYGDRTLDQITLSELVEYESVNKLDVAGIAEIGRRYYLGIGCDKDYDKAQYYLIKADDFGDLSGENCKILGDMYYNGYGVELKEDKAVEYYLAAIDKEYLDADIYRNLGHYYYQLEDYVQSIFYFSRAAAMSKDDTMDMTNVGLAYYANGDYARALEWYGKAIDGNAENTDYLKKRIKEMVDDGYVSEKDAQRWLDVE